MLKNLTATALALALSTAAFAEQSQSINVYNWNDYIDPELVADFTKETGISVNYATFKTADEMEAVVRDGDVDVVYPGLDILRSFIRNAYIQTYSTDEVTNTMGVQNVIRARMASKDPNARYAAPYLWGRIGLLVDREKAEAALGKPLESSWSMVLDPDNASKLAQCGISFLDARDYAYSIAMNYRGENLDFPTRTSVRRYSQLMMTLRPYYKVVDAAAHLDMVPKGELCVSMVWEGDANVLQAGNDKLEFILPSEGTVMFVDTMAITRRAQNPEGARRWVEFMMREENAQRNAEYTGYNSPLQAVYDRMTENLDEAARKAKNEFSRVPTFMSIQPRPDINDMIAKAWNTFVSGDKLVAADSSKVVSYQ